MSIEAMFVAIAGMIAFVVVVHMINKAEIEKVRATSAAAADKDGVKVLLEDNAAEISRLRARVEVLERLATDGDRKLAGEINSLRSESRT